MTPMRFAFTEDQELSKQNFGELLEKSCTPGMVRAAWETDSGAVEGLRAALCGFGFPALLAPEHAGGVGLSDVDVVLMLEQSGRAAASEPLIETAAVAVPLLSAFASHRRVEELLGRAARGDAIVAVSVESNRYAANADVADAVIAERGDAAYLVDRANVDLVRQPSVAVARGSSVRTAFDDAESRGALMTAAELVGLGEHLVETTVEYAKTRHQFGQPIGSFQAVKHQLADAYQGVAFARPLVYRAAHALAHAEADRAVHVSAAKAFASDAANRAARVALQVHGAIGYSFEHDLHLWMKRVWCLSSAWGDAAHHRRRVADHLLGEVQK
jgi:alkylation response protein AidB-like acyl-CoA dehydrogenase